MAANSSIRISVVIAAYNAAATIGRAVESCLQQSLPPFEIIIVDDASTDATQEVLKQFGARISVFYLKENKGPAAARNRGIRQAKGNFIAFLDADDYWHPDKIKIVNRVLAQSPGISFLYHDYVLERPEQLPLPVLPRAISFYSLLLRNLMATPCVIVQKQQGLQFDESLRYMEDYELWLRLAAQQKAWHLPLPLTILDRPILSAGGQSSNRWAMRKAELKVYSLTALRHKWLLPVLPVLWLYSLIKHVRKVMG